MNSVALGALGALEALEASASVQAVEAVELNGADRADGADAADGTRFARTWTTWTTWTRSKCHRRSAAVQSFGFLLASSTGAGRDASAVTPGAKLAVRLLDISIKLTQLFNCSCPKIGTHLLEVVNEELGVKPLQGPTVVRTAGQQAILIIYCLTLNWDAKVSGDVFTQGPGKLWRTYEVTHVCNIEPIMKQSTDLHPQHLARDWWRRLARREHSRCGLLQLGIGHKISKTTTIGNSHGSGSWSWPSRRSIGLNCHLHPELPTLTTPVERI